MQKGPRLFFVLGVPKSGTTWLQRLLDAHPNILCTGEGALHWYLADMRRVVQDYNRHLAARSEIFQKQLFPPLAAPELHRLTRHFILQRLQSAVGKLPDGIAWLGNKDPDHGNNMPAMARLFPRAVFLHIIRDGRDQVVSLWRHMRRHHPNFQPERFADLDIMVKERAPNWADYIRKVHQVASQAKLRYHELRYEDLQSEPEVTFHKVLEFLNVDDSGPEVLQHCLAAADFKQLSGGRERGEEDVDSFFRKGVSGDWRNHLSEEQSAAFCAASGGLMVELGYTNSP